MTDWYRNTTWDDATRDAFLARLARSRTQRDQYIVLQALTLAPVVPEAALELVELYFETRTDDFDDGRAEFARSQALLALGRIDDVADALRKTVALDAANDGLKTGAAQKYAAHVITHRMTDRYAEIDALLGDAPDRFLMPVEGHGWYAARAVIAEFAGDRDQARHYARAALREAARETSDLPGHPKLGLVTDTDSDLQKWLIEMAGPQGEAE
jgi:tetratricopeptide (TPR) repeat protein